MKIDFLCQIIPRMLNKTETCGEGLLAANQFRKKKSLFVDDLQEGFMLTLHWCYSYDLLTCVFHSLAAAQ